MGIYLDNAATTPLHPDVKRVMIDLIESDMMFGNPSSVHQFGRKAKMALEDARDEIAHSLCARPNEIIFTSGGSESINSAILGAAYANEHRGKHIITSTIEHHAVLHTCQYLQKKGWEVTYIPVDERGVVDLQAVRDAVREDTVLASLMYANNETGVIQPLEVLAKIFHQKGVIFHSDMVQTYGQLPVDVSQLPIDLISTSAHKLHGPKGAGVLYVRSKLPWHPLLYGGSQERGRRAGTENLVSIVGFAEAVKLVNREYAQKAEHLRSVKHAFLQTLEQRLPAQFWQINGMREGLPSIVNISFMPCDAETLLMQLDMEGIACSHGSACTSGSLEPSHVLQAMGLTEQRIRSSIRVSFGGLNSVDEVTLAARTMADIVLRHQNQS